MAKSDINLLLLAGSDTLNVKVLYCLHPCFKNIHVVADSEDSLVKYTRYKKFFTHCDWNATGDRREKSIEYLKSYCKQNNIEVILPGDLAASAFLNSVKNDFPDQKLFPTMSIEELTLLDNKWLFGQRLSDAGIQTPKSILLERQSDFSETRQSEIESQIGFPLMLKPLFGEASEGIKKINTFSDLNWHINEVLGPDMSPVLLQPYIDGYDAGFSVIAENGDVKVKAVQIILDVDVLEYRPHKRIEELGEKIVKLINYSGAANFDLRIDYHTDEIYVIECNPRFWFTIPSAKWQGLNFPEAAVNYAAEKNYNTGGAKGIILSPGLAIKSLIKKPWRYFTYSKAQRSYIWQVILDPWFHFNKSLRL